MDEDEDMKCVSLFFPDFELKMELRLKIFRSH